MLQRALSTRLRREAAKPRRRARRRSTESALSRRRTRRRGRALRAPANPEDEFARSARDARRGERAERRTAPRTPCEPSRVAAASVACQRRRRTTRSLPSAAAAASVKVAEALTTLGRFVGIATATEAVVDASVPFNVAAAEALPPVCPLTVTTTGVPGGMFVPASVTVTGCALDAGSVMSGGLKEAVGADGVERPPMDVIVSTGPPASAIAEGDATDGTTLLTLSTAVLL